MLTWLLENRGNVPFEALLLMLFSYAVLVFVMLPVHEMAHAFAAHLLGDDTAKWNGRLRFNPLRHLDPLGTTMLVLFGVGFARPVPINPYNFRNRKAGVALSSLAGPLSNLLMAFLSVAAFWLCRMFVDDFQVLTYLWVVLVNVFATVNISLAVFNLLPIPPLDGSKIFGFFLPERWVYTMERYSHYVSVVLMVLLFSGALDVPLDFLRETFCNFFGRLFGMPYLFNGYI